MPKSFVSDLRFRFLHSETRRSERVFPLRLNYLVEFNLSSRVRKKWSIRIDSWNQPVGWKIKQVQPLPIPCATRPQHVHRTSAVQQAGDFSKHHWQCGRMIFPSFALSRVFITCWLFDIFYNFPLIYFPAFHGSLYLSSTRKFKKLESDTLNDHLNPTTILLLAGFARARAFKQL